MATRGRQRPRFAAGRPGPGLAQPSSRAGRGRGPPRPRAPTTSREPSAPPPLPSPFVGRAFRVRADPVGGLAFRSFLAHASRLAPRAGWAPGPRARPGGRPPVTRACRVYIPLSTFPILLSVFSALPACQIDLLVPAVANPAGPIMDADSSVSSSLCAHRALTRRLPTRVVRHGPGSRLAGLSRFVQLRKERYSDSESSFSWLLSFNLPDNSKQNGLKLKTKSERQFNCHEELGRYCRGGPGGGPKLNFLFFSSFGPR
jgi:hypothetical protein